MVQSLPEQAILLAIDDSKNLCRYFLPALVLCYPCLLQEVLLAVLLAVLLEIVFPFLTDLQMGFELHQGDTKGVLYFLDACGSLQIPPILVPPQLVFDKQTVDLFALDPDD